MEFMYKTVPHIVQNGEGIQEANFNTVNDT